MCFNYKILPGISRQTSKMLATCKSASCTLELPMAEDDFSKRRERFFFLLGYAITRWAYIDRSLFDFCKFALNTTERKTAIVFTAVRTSVNILLCRRVGAG